MIVLALAIPRTLPLFLPPLKVGEKGNQLRIAEPHLTPEPVNPKKQRNPPVSDPCSYCGRNNHNARNCYKRQEDEKKKSPPPHKQAHQSILVDETAFQFSQSVLSISHSDFNPHHHGDDWGESTQEQEDPQEQDVPTEEQQQANEPDKTIPASSCASDHGYILTLTDTRTTKDPDTACQQIQHESSSELAALTYREDTPIEIEASQSSSSEPSWGQYRHPTQQELEHEWQVWDKTNNNEQQRTTKAYRHGRCDSCNKPISTSILDMTDPLLCLECVPKCVTPEPEKLVQPTKQGLGKTGRDDEEEWSGIPIPQSDDSDDEYWLDESDESESEQHEDDSEHPSLNLRNPDDDQDDASANLTSLTQQTSISPETKGQKHMSIQHINDYAFLIGRRLDGRIQRKDGTILTLQEQPTNEKY